MSKLFREDKIFEFDGELYSYRTLSELKLKSPKYRSGDVTNIETGEFIDISQLELFIKGALYIVEETIKENLTLSAESIRDVNRKVLNIEHKGVMKDIYDKMENSVDEENPVVSYEDVMLYWELKRLYEQVDFYYSNNNFIKMDIGEISISMLRKLSQIDRGRLIDLVSLIEYKKENIKISRKDLMELIGYDDTDSLKHFIKRLEDIEIIKSINKTKKPILEIYINPFVFNRVGRLDLSTHLLEYFPKSSKSFLKLDVYWYYKMLLDKSIGKVEVEG